MAKEYLVSRLADAIAFAEGFYVPGSRPQRNNNPGDLTVDVTGGAHAVSVDGIYMVYATPEDGWEDLKQQIRLMLDNASRIYSSDMTIMEVAEHYTTTEVQSWARNVADRLGVSVDTRIADIVTEAGSEAIFLIFVFLWYLNKKRS